MKPEEKTILRQKYKGIFESIVGKDIIEDMLKYIDECPTTSIEELWKNEGRRDLIKYIKENVERSIRDQKRKELK